MEEASLRRGVLNMPYTSNTRMVHAEEINMLFITLNATTKGLR